LDSATVVDYGIERRKAMDLAQAGQNGNGFDKRGGLAPDAKRRIADRARYAGDFPSGARPVFVHAMWRTGSTYVWAKFRENPRYRAYYEPLHEVFINVSMEALEAVGSDEAADSRRHPHLKASYFAEFQELVEAGAISFEKSFPYRRYCLGQTDEERPLRRYVADLLVLALANGQTPVLQFNRSLLRTGWLTAHFNPINILLLRRPIDVWKSFISFEHRYFPTVVCMIAGQNQHQPILHELVKRHNVPFFIGENVQSDYAFYHEYAAGNLGKLYPLFYELYLLTSIYAARYADCIIDLNEITESASSREAVAERLRALGVDISLDDCHLPRYTDLSAADRECLAYEETALDFLGRSLAPQHRIPRKRFEPQRPMIGEYFREIFADFLGGVKDAPWPIPQASAKELHQAGLDRFERGQAREAAMLFGDAILEQPSADLWNDWASAQMACGRPQLAETGFRRALEISSRNKQAAANLAALLVSHTRYQEAIPLLERALQDAKGRENRALTNLLSHCRCQQALAEATRIARGE